MKRIVSLLLSLVLLLGLFSFTSAEDETTLPKIGDELNGFVVNGFRHFDMIGADIVDESDMAEDLRKVARERRARVTASAKK